jgi:hypothetical protein
MNRPATPSIGKAINCVLRSDVGPTAISRGKKKWESSNFGTPNFRPEPGFAGGGEFIVASLGTSDFTFNVEDWDRAVRTHPSKRMIQPLPDGGFRGGDFPTHFQ